MNCGNQIPSDAAFCPSCGKPIRTSAVSTPATGPQPYGPVATTPATGPQPYGPVATNVPLGLLEARDIVMKKKIMSVREHYDFEDPSGRKLGEGDGNFFQAPAKFVVLSSPDSLGNSGEEIMHIDGKIISIRHEFNFYDARGQQLGSMKKKIAKLVGQEYWLEQNGQEIMRVYGNFTAHDYLMSINGQPVAQVHEKWVSVRDQFGVSITGNVDPRLVLGSVIVVEHLEVTQRNGNSGLRIGI